MDSTLREADLRGLLDVLDVARRPPRQPRGCLRPCSKISPVLMGCDSVSFMEFDIAGQECLRGQTSPEEVAITPSPTTMSSGSTTRTTSTAVIPPAPVPHKHSVTLASDFYSTRESHNTAMYREYTRYFGVEHEALLCLPAPPGRSTRLLFTRGPGGDFDERDRLCSRCCGRTCRSSTKRSSADGAPCAT